jgi:S-formylglutathione hydrolase FrmB
VSEQDLAIWLARRRLLELAATSAAAGAGGGLRDPAGAVRAGGGLRKQPLPAAAVAVVPARPPLRQVTPATLVRCLRFRVRHATLALGVALAVTGSPAAVANPLHLLGVTRLDARLEQLAFRTPAVLGTTRVRVLLPSGYNSHPRRRYPVLYLLHGAADNYTSWTLKGNAERFTAADPLIIVMPDTGPSGGYTDWYNGGAGGPPEWETYHIVQLIPWIDGHLRTLPTRAARAIAGLSMGGFGAMSYAARHPDLFAAAASFSGAVDTNNPLDIAVTGNQVFGPRPTQEARWRAHNPWDLAENLRGLSLTVRTGNGLPGGPFGGGDIIELAVHQMSVSFHSRLVRLGIPSIWDDYGPGGHTWPYWQRDLRETLPTIMSGFAHPRAPNSSFTFTAAEARYGVYGWFVSWRRPALEFNTLRVRGRREFSLTGSGRASVTTAPLCRAGRVVTVVVRDAAGTRRRLIRADRSGRLRVALALGPGNRYQQYTAQAAQLPRRSRTADVRIEGLG